MHALIDPQRGCSVFGSTSGSWRSSRARGRHRQRGLLAGHFDLTAGRSVTSVGEVRSFASGRADRGSRANIGCPLSSATRLAPQSRQRLSCVCAGGRGWRCAGGWSRGGRGRIPFPPLPAGSQRAAPASPPDPPPSAILLPLSLTPFSSRPRSVRPTVARTHTPLTLLTHNERDPTTSSTRSTVRPPALHARSAHDPSRQRRCAQGTITMNSYHSAARHPSSNRLSEMLDAIKAEFDNVSQEASAYKNYKDDYEHKSQSRPAPRVGNPPAADQVQSRRRSRRCSPSGKTSTNSRWPTRR